MWESSDFEDRGVDPEVAAKLADQFNHHDALKAEIDVTLEKAEHLTELERAAIHGFLGDIVLAPVSDMGEFQLPAGFMVAVVDRLCQLPLAVKLLEAWNTEVQLTRFGETVDGPTGRAVENVMDTLRPLVALL